VAVLAVTAAQLVLEVLAGVVHQVQRLGQALLVKVMQEVPHQVLLAQVAVGLALLDKIIHQPL
jgi:hypothetical protein